MVSVGLDKVKARKNGKAPGLDEQGRSAAYKDVAWRGTSPMRSRATPMVAKLMSFEAVDAAHRDQQHHRADEVQHDTLRPASRKAMRRAPITITPSALISMTSNHTYRLNRSASRRRRRRPS